MRSADAREPGEHDHGAGDETLSPAERYAASRRRARHPVLVDFEAHYPFGLDEFQLEACRDLEDGRGVLVAAPTGSGKTVVGEFACHLALAGGRKCFYTTPIKALSNQKHADLVRRYGADQVGLLTGDHAVNGDAPIVVMTTEVLRNMLYAGSGTLTDLGYVVMDEVHYLADRMRGAVWEEVIIHLPDSVSLVSLSATVSNAEELGEWLETVRGDTSTIVEERRPVPLFQHVMVGRRLHDLFADSDVDARAGFVREGAKVNSELLRVARDDMVSSRVKDRRSPKGARSGRGRGGPAGRGSGPRQVGNGRRVWIPSRPEVLTRLDRDGLLPAIVFVFSRAGCAAAVEQCLDADLRLTTPAERDSILAFVEERCRHLPDEDRRVLGYARFAEGLSRGVASHHAGMLPTFKECVEELFVQGLVKAVFATETLALGINMPARTVVIEKLSKWNGETHADITPGEYTQLTGRAGRRGLDVEGHAVVLWQPGIDPAAVAGLASTRTYPLRSSFRPSYNMAVNLVAQVGRERSRDLLEQSFAQFQADASVVGLAAQLKKAEDALGGYAEAATCDRGDFMAYAALRRQISQVEKNAAKARRMDLRDEAGEALGRLRRGDVVAVPAGKFAGWVVVIDPGTDGREPRPLVVTEGRQARRLSLLDFPTPVAPVTTMKVPKSFDGRNPQQRRDLASALHLRTRDLDRPSRGSRGAVGLPSAVETEIAALREQLAAHPCHHCPDREDHARWAERWHRLHADAETLRERVERRTHTVARSFDRVCQVLDELDYLEGDTVTDRGRRLRRLHGEMDLVAAEALRRGLWDGLDASELAAAVSVLVYEARRPEDAAEPRLPRGPVVGAVQQTVRLWRELDTLEKDHRLDYLRPPDLGFAWAAWRWAEGGELDDVLAGTDLAAGDFVRWVRQLLDLIDQVAAAAGGGPLRTVAREAGTRLRRGVVAYSSLTE
jgi:ATP-dependent RNA helicase HelY